jgi:hypothetical protein
MRNSSMPIFLDDYTRMAFEENLAVYNAVFTTDAGYQYMRNQMTSFKEIARFTIYSGGAIPETKFEEILVSKKLPLIDSRNRYHRNRIWLVSRAFLEECMEVPLYEFDSGMRAILYCYSRSKIVFPFASAGYLKVMNMKSSCVILNLIPLLHKQTYSRLLISRNDAIMMRL